MIDAPSVPLTLGGRSLPRRRMRVGVRRTARGFTLVELMAAMAAGMMVAMGAFTFAKAATRSFQQEARVANATAASMLGFRRLSADIQRASFLSTPNIQREFRYEQDVCEDPTAAPAAFANLTGLAIAQSGSYAAAGTNPVIDLANKAAPDRLTITGSFDTTEIFFVASVSATGGNTVVIQLQKNSGAVSRAMQPGADGQPSLGIAIQVGRIGRLIDTAGMHHYGVITAVAVNPGGAPQVTLGGAPQVAVQGTPFAGALHPRCKTGVPGNGVGSLFNVVNRVQYEVRDLRNDPTYAVLYPSPSPVATDDAASAPEKGRHELVRTEIDTSGAQVGPAEVIAEYAVDLRFGATIDTAGIPVIDALSYQPTLTTYDVGSAAIYPYALNASVATAGPERIKSLRVRLAVRSREGDRDADVPPALLPVTLNGGPGSGGAYRYLLSNGTYARVRTMQAELSLPNQSGVFW